MLSFFDVCHLSFIRKYRIKIKLQTERNKEMSENILENENKTVPDPNGNTLKSFLWNNKWFILAAIAFFIQLWIIPKNAESIRFGPKLIDSLFTYFSFNAPFFIISFIIFRKNFSKCIFFGQLFGGIVMFVLWQRHFEVYYLINSWMDDLLVRYAMPFKFITASINGGSQLWSFMLSFYGGVILLIYGNWFINKKRVKDGLWKIERQVLWTGLGVYGIINILIWVFTHFTFVGTNYIYMHQSVKYVDRIVEFYDNKQEKERFALKELRYFKNKDELLAYYKHPLFMERANQKDRIGFLNGSLSVIERFDQPGANIEIGISYNNMERFHDWMSVVMNWKHLGQDRQKNSVWNVELSPAIYVDPKYQDVTRHSLMYVKKAKDGGYYGYIVFDRTFKDFRQNYIFNLLFGLFHLIFIPLFIYLLHLHKKKNLQNSAVIKQMKDIE